MDIDNTEQWNFDPEKPEEWSEGDQELFRSNAMVSLDNVVSLLKKYPYVLKALGSRYEIMVFRLVAPIIQEKWLKEEGFTPMMADAVFLIADKAEELIKDYLQITIPPKNQP